MKIDYFFPVFKEDSAKDFLTSFVKSNFFLEHSEFEMFFVVENSDKQNLEFLSAEAIRHPEYKVIVADGKFSYNDAFSLAIEYFKADVVLLGDMKLARNDLIFESCLQKKQKNASVVHVVKKRTGFKGFWFNLCAKVYNFFIKIYTGKKDRLNIVSLGLIDKNIVELLQVLPNKRCFIKNTKDLKGFETRTIYVNPNTKVYRPKFKQKTNALITFFVSLGVFFLSILATLLINYNFSNVPPIANIFLIFIIFASLILCAMNLPKHFYDCRNKDFLCSKVSSQVLNLQTKKQTPSLSKSDKSTEDFQPLTKGKKTTGVEESVGKGASADVKENLKASKQKTASSRKAVPKTTRENKSTKQVKKTLNGSKKSAAQKDKK